MRYVQRWVHLCVSWWGGGADLGFVVLNPVMAETIAGQLAHAEHSKQVVDGTSSSGSSLSEKVRGDVNVEQA